MRESVYLFIWENEPISLTELINEFGDEVHQDLATLVLTGSLSMEVIDGEAWYCLA